MTTNLIREILGFKSNEEYATLLREITDDALVKIALAKVNTSIIDLNDALSKVMKACRKRSGLTQEALAEKLFCSRSDISKYENNKSGVSVDLFLKFCEETNSLDAFIAFFYGQEGLDWLIARFRNVGAWSD